MYNTSELGDSFSSLKIFFWFLEFSFACPRCTLLELDNPVLIF